MQINVTIALTEGETTGAAETLATDVLAAIGDPDKDLCTVVIMPPAQTGNAGTMPAPPAPPE